MTWIIGVIVALWLLGNLGVARLATRPPRTPILCSPGVMGAPQDEVLIRSHDLIELSGWWVQGSHPTSVAVLTHGYLLSKGELAPVAYLLWQHGVSCLLFDFRAHGKTIGGASTMGYLEKDDVQSALEWVKRRNPDSRVVLIGSSMGSVANAIAWSENPELAHALVLDSAYANLGKAALGFWRFLGGRWMQLLLWPSVYMGVLFTGFNPFSIQVPEYLEGLKGRPMMLMHGTDDPVASVKEAGKNLHAMGPETKAVWFQGSSHSEGRWERPETYRENLLEFLGSIDFLQPKDREIDND